MSLSIKEKIIASDMQILSQKYLRKILKISEKKYDIDTLISYGYITVIKKGESYYNLLIKNFKNAYLLGGAYMGFQKYMFGGFDRYNKEGFITQVSNIFTIYNLKYSRSIKILGIEFRLKKVKKEFLYGEKEQKIGDFSIFYMDRERLFIEYVRDYGEYDDTFFMEIIDSLDITKIQSYIKVYPLKKVVNKINTMLCT